jgi:hypothetical protein
MHRSLSLSFSLSLLFFLSALFQRTTLASDHFPQNNRVPLPRGLLSSGLFGSNFMRCRCHRLAALNARPCFARNSLSCLSFHLNACLRINLPVLFMTRFCRDILCRHGGHVILDLLRLCCRYLFLNSSLIGLRTLASLVYPLMPCLVALSCI